MNKAKKELKPKVENFKFKLHEACEMVMGVGCPIQIDMHILLFMNDVRTAIIL